MSSNDELSAAIQKDKEGHPDCNYGLTTSQKCESINGTMHCETIKRVLRYCPGERPCEIFSSSNKDEGNRSGGGSGGVGLGGFGDNNHELDHMHDQMRQLERLFDRFSGGNVFGGNGSFFQDFPQQHLYPNASERTEPRPNTTPQAPHRFPKGHFPAPEKTPARQDITEV